MLIEKYGIYIKKEWIKLKSKLFQNFKMHLKVSEKKFEKKILKFLQREITKSRI